MKCSVMENRERDRFITREEAQAVLDACPDAQWRLLFALSRFGGLRCPWEHLGLRWGDVDWERTRFTVHSAQEARKGKPSRLMPLFPELRPYLEAVFDAGRTGQRGARHHPLPGPEQPISGPSLDASSAGPAWNRGRSCFRTSARPGRRSWFPRAGQSTRFASGWAIPRPSPRSTTGR